MAGFVVPVGAKVLSHLIKALPSIGITGLAATGGGLVVGRGGRALGLPGTSDKDVARGETYDLQTDEITSTGLDDKFRNFFLGTDQTKINELTKARAVDSVNNSTKTDRLDLLQRSQQFGGGLTSERLKRQENETLADTRARLQREETKIGVREYASLNDVDISKLGPNPSQAAVAAVIRKQDPTSDLNTLKRQENQRSDDLKYQADLLGYNERSANADRALTRETNANNRRENIQLRMMDSSDRRADRRSADLRADRKERQMMILQMIKGIQQGVSAI